MAKILLTGGSGFIGSSLIKNLLNEGHEIVVYDNLERNSLKDFSYSTKVKFRKVDILNYHELYQSMFFDEPIIIIHLAALCGVDNVLSRPIKTMEVIALGTHNLLKSVLENKLQLQKFINFSTSEVYGSYSYKLGEDEKTNLGAVGEARWTYSVSKLFAEHLAFSYYKEYGIPVVSIRPFNIYGPGQVGEGALQIFIKKCLKNEDIEIHDDGSQIRSWCYIDDATDFIMKCINSDNVVGNILNMGNPEGTITTIGLAKRIIELTGSKSKIKFIESPCVDVELRIPNIDKARKILKFEPKVSLDEGILKTFEWYKRNN